MQNELTPIGGASTFHRNTVLGLAVVAALASTPGIGRAANVTLTASDAINNTSFTSGTRWSDGQIPNPANDYFVPLGLTLRTPFDVASAAFGGNSLTVGDNGTGLSLLIIKTLTNSTVTVNNLTLNKGSVQNGGTAAGAATSVTLTSNAITLDVGGGTFDTSPNAGRIITVNAPIGGAGSVSVIGMGATTFAGTNTYTGITTVSAGALNAVDGVGLPTASPLALLGGALGTSGTFTRGLGTGAGQVTVTGAGGFTAVGGDLVVALGGTAAPTPLAVGVDGFGPALMTLNYSTATNAIDFRNGVDLNGTATFGLTVNSNTLATAGTFSGNLSDSVGGGVFTKFGNGLLTLTGTNTQSGRTAVNQGILRAAEGTGLPATTNLSFNGGLFAPTATFTRGLGTGPGQVQFIAAGTGGFAAVGNDVTVALGGSEAPTPLVWGTTEAFNPGVLTLGGRIGTNTVTFANAIDLSTATAATTRTVASLGGVNVISGVISNTGAAQGTLAIEGDGTAVGGVIVLAAANTYGGTTLIDAGVVGSGTVRATNNASFGTSLIQFNAGGNGTTARLELTNNVTIANNINLSGRNTVTDAVRNVAGDNTLAGTISVGTGGGLYAIQSDGGTLTLSGANGSTAGTAVTSAATGGRNVTLQGAGNGVVSGLIANGAGTVQLTKLGTGTWTLTAANTFSGPVAIGGGTLQLGDGTSGRDGTISSAAGVSTSAGVAPNVTNGTLAFNRFGNDNTAAYAIGGAGNVAKLGRGTQTLTGANAYTGNTTVSAGTLRATAAAYANTVLGAGTGGLAVEGGRFVFDYNGTTSPLSTVKAALIAGYNQPTKFATGTIRSAAAAAPGLTLGYGETGDSTVTVALTLPGDADLNGQVNFADFVSLQSSFGQTGVTFLQGDFDFNDSVSFSDFVLLQSNFGRALNGARAEFSREEYAAVMSIMSAGQVPEPASVAVLGLTAAGLLRRRRTA